SIVGGSFCRSLLHPCIKGSAQRLAFVLDGKINQRGGTAEGGRAGSGLKIVGAGGAAEGHIQMRVNVNPARHDIPVLGVNNTGGVVARESLPNGHDLAAADSYVSRIGISCGDYGSVYDQCVKSHCASSVFRISQRSCLSSE